MKAGVSTLSKFSCIFFISCHSVSSFHSRTILFAYWGSWVCAQNLFSFLLCSVSVRFYSVVFVFCCCCNKSPQIQWLRTRQMCVCRLCLIWTKCKMLTQHRFLESRKSFVSLPSHFLVVLYFNFSCLVIAFFFLSSEQTALHLLGHSLESTFRIVLLFYFSVFKEDYNYTEPNWIITELPTEISRSFLIHVQIFCCATRHSHVSSI